MRYLSTAVVLVLAATLAVYAAVEKKPKKKALETRDRVFSDFESKKASLVVVERVGEKPIRLVKKGKRWLIERPVRFPADGSAVETLLTDLEMLTFSRKLPKAGKTAEYGLDKPRIVVRVEGVLPGGKQAVLKVGAKDVTGRDIYVAVGQDAFVVGKHLLDSLDKDLDGWRDKSAFLVGEGKVLEVSWTRDGTPVHLVRDEKRDEYFLVAGDGTRLARAHRDTASDIFRRVEDLSVTRFVSSGKGSLAKAGLDKPALTITAKVDKELRKVLVGGTCVKGGKTYDSEVLAGRPGQLEAVFCLKKRDVDFIARLERRLRDIKLLASTADQLEGLEIRAGGKTLRLKRKDDGWHILEPKLKKDKSDGDLVGKFLEDVQSFSVLAFRFPAPTQLASLGLDKPQAALVLERSDGTKEVLQVGKVEGPHVFVRRKGEAAVLSVHKELLDYLRPDPLLFRDRQVLDFDQFDLKRIEAISGGVKEVLERKDDAWQLIQPLEIKADEDAVDALVRQASALRARKFVARAPKPAFGLTGPSARTLRFKVQPPAHLPMGDEKDKEKKEQKKPVWHEIVVGGDTPSGDGCYGMTKGGEQLVFELDKAACEDLRARLADRRLADIKPADVQAVTYQGPKGRWELERKGPDWYAKAGPKVDNTKVEGLLTTIQGLRATRIVRYGKAGPAEGAPKPYLRIVLHIKDGKTVELLLGSEVRGPEGKAEGRAAWRADRPIVYVLPTYSVSDLEKFSL